MSAAPVLYYGVEQPDPSWAQACRGPVVLQPYHPLLDQGGFADAFPGARRYAYLNPTAVPLDHESLAALPTTTIEPQWGLARLDLSDVRAEAHVVRTALDVLARDGARSHGLFVDDLDLLLDAVGPDRTLRLLDSLREQAAGWWPGRRVGLIANRGFALWRDLGELDGVLCEELSALDVDRIPDHGRRWVRDAVLPALRALQARGVPAYALTYDTDERPATAGSEEACELDALLSGTVLSTHHLDTWSTS